MAGKQGKWKMAFWAVSALVLGCFPVAVSFSPSSVGSASFALGRSSHKALQMYSVRPAARCMRGGISGLRAQGRGDDESSGSQYSEDEEESMEKMKKTRQLPFDKGASEFVPNDMQPANEWQSLKETFLFDWPLEGTPQFAQKVVGCFVFWFLFSLPIASETWSADSEVAPRLLASLLGGAIPTLLILLRLLAGVKMVSDRLEQDAVYFESDERRPTTAVDLQRMGYRNQGATWIKPSEIAARDKLIRQFEVTPVLDRLKKATAATALLILVGMPLYSQSTTVSYFDPRFATNQANLDKLRSTSFEDVANREADRLRERGNKPAYCYSRYYKAVATSDLEKCR